MTSNKYRIEVVWSPKDEMYVGTCPEFAGLAVVCESQEEAFKEARFAIEDYIEIFNEDGIPLPEPRVAKEFSGQIRLRLPKSLHGQASEMAQDDGISLNQLIVNALQSIVTCKNTAREVARELVQNTPVPFVVINNFSSSRNELMTGDVGPEYAETANESLMLTTKVEDSELVN